MTDFPKRLVSIFYGEDHRIATVWQDLKTKEYVVDRKAVGIQSGFNNRYDNAADAEDSAEDWVMQQ
jgi:hypothetical protein